jgi:hypothetical protein
VVFLALHNYPKSLEYDILKISDDEYDLTETYAVQLGSALLDGWNNPVMDDHIDYDAYHNVDDASD